MTSALRNKGYRLVELLMLLSIIAIMAMWHPKAHGQAPQDQAVTGPADLIMKVSGAKGTYIQMAQQMSAVCPNPSLSIQTSDGQLSLYNDLVTNQANLGMLTYTILYGKKSVERDLNVDKLVVVMPMYTAEMHIIALRSNGQLNRFSDVVNKKVGTYGGAHPTTRIMLSQGQLRPFSLQDYKSEDSLLQALQKGEVDIGFIEVGQPAPWAKTLNGQTFKLLQFDRSDLLGRNGFVRATLNYPNLSSTAVETMGTQVYLVSQNYKGEKKVHDISAFKECIKKNIVTLREETNFHPKWEQVNPDAQSEWPMFKTVSVAGKQTVTKKKQ